MSHCIVSYCSWCSSVSYTHLDVYKRQATLSGCSSWYEIEDYAEEYKDDLEACLLYTSSVTSVSDKGDGGTSYSNEVLSVGAYELPFYDNFSNGELCNQLYTFIDVYKRQVPVLRLS